MITSLFEPYDLEEDFTFPRLRERPDSCPPSPHNDEGIFPNFLEDWSYTDQAVPLLDIPQEALKKVAEDKNMKDTSEGDKEKKGKKRQVFKTIKPEEMKKEMRAEKNRQFARESRDRKKEYLKYLEMQVTQLKQTVDYYRYKLSKYELMEKFTDIQNDAQFLEMQNVCWQARNSNQLFQSKFNFPEQLKKGFDKVMEERERAIEMLMRKLIETVVPLPARVNFWLSEQNIDIDDLEKVHKVMNMQIPLEQYKQTMKSIEKMFGNKDKFTQTKKSLKEALGRVKVILKQLITNGQKIKNEFKKINRLFTTVIMCHKDSTLCETMMKAFSQYAFKPEIVNFTDWLFNDVQSTTEGTFDGDSSSPSN